MSLPRASGITDPLVTHPAFPWALGRQTQVLTMTQQMFSPRALAYLPDEQHLPCALTGVQGPLPHKFGLDKLLENTCYFPDTGLHAITWSYINCSG